MKNSNFSALGLTISLGLTACGAAQPKPQSCAMPPIVSASSSAPVAPPSLNTATATPAKPKTEEEFYANVLSCEATANANSGYLQSIGRRLESNSFAPGQLPCNIIRDIHDNLQRVVDHCAVVVEPASIYLEIDPSAKIIRQRLASQAADVTSTSREGIAMILKQAPQCFGAKNDLVVTLTPPVYW